MDPVYKSKMESYVAEQLPKLQTVNNKDLESMFENFSPDQIVENTNLTSDEVVDSFRLSLITESLTEQYSETYKIGAETILYDISACSYFIKPVPAESDNLLKNVIDKETIVNLGRIHLAAQGQFFEDSGIKTSFLLPEKNGFKHLIDRAIEEKVDLIVMDDYYSSPGLMDRLAGNSLSNLDHNTEIEVILYKQIKTQISVTSGS